MGHTPPPLRIGVDNNGVGYTHPPEQFEREIDEPIEVEVETPCVVRFDDNMVFEDKDYDRPQSDTWRPKIHDNCTAHFDVYPYHSYAITGAHSIKIGSGRLVKEPKAQSKKPKAKRTAANRTKRRKQNK